MMTTLFFIDDGWRVMTSAWTAAWDRSDEVEICYLWGASGFSLVAGATGVRKVTLPVSVTEFHDIIRRSKDGICDLRRYGDLV